MALEPTAIDEDAMTAGSLARSGAPRQAAFRIVR